MKFDSHLHTLPFSQDARQSIHELIPALKEKSLGGVITEHMDYDFPLDPEIVLFNPEDYFAQYEPYRSETLLLGVEIGMRESCRDRNELLAKSYPWDFLLVSVHTLYGEDLCKQKFYEDRNQKTVYQDYLQSLIDETKAHDSFDSLAHIDYICRYNPYPEPNLHYQDFPDLWDELFSILAKKEKALEINTRRLMLPGAQESLFELSKRFRELGGRYVTIGSDAHIPHSVGKYLDVGYDMAEKANLIPVYYKNRKLQKI